MLPHASLSELASIAQFAGSMCQVGTAIIAVGIGLMTFRYTKRQSTLSLGHQNNTLANLVNTTIINSEAARQSWGKLQDCIVGSPDDAILFMYLNYVHNTYRMRQIGAVSAQLWQDTLSSCVAMLGRLRRDQLVRLLARGYEAGFQSAVLARYAELAPHPESNVLSTMRPWGTPRLAAAG